MPKENEGVKSTDMVEIEVRGKKFKVTKAFKDEIDADRAELTAKVTGLETDKKTLSQKLAELDGKPPKTKQGDDAIDDGDGGIDIIELMDKPQSAIDKAVKNALKKLGIDQSKTGDVDKKINTVLQQQKFWDAFWKEHPYFDEEHHSDLIQLAAFRLKDKIKDKSVKEGRQAIAEYVADMMGRKIVKGSLEYATKPKHEAENGMQLEGADGGVVDSGENANDTSTSKGKTGSMAEDLKRRREARMKAAKGK